MSNYPPDEPVYPATPIHDEAIAVAPTTFDQQSGSDSKTSQAADRARETAGQAADTVKQTAGDAKEQAAQVASTAKDAGADVASTTKEAGAQVAGTAKGEAQRVVADTVSQARDLYGQATTELSSQAGKQQERLRETIRTFGQDLDKLGRGERVDSGPAAELVQNLAGRAHRAAEWLEGRSPEDVLYEVRQFAARRPGLFIGLAAVTGVVAARLTKALRAEATGGTARGLTGGSSYEGYDGFDGSTAGTYVGGVGETALPTPVGTEYATGGQYTGAGYGTPYGAGATDPAVDEFGTETEYGTEYAPENEYGTGTEPGTTGGLR